MPRTRNPSLEHPHLKTMTLTKLLEIPHGIYRRQILLRTRTRSAPCNKFEADPLRTETSYQHGHNQAPKAATNLCNDRRPLFPAAYHLGSTWLDQPTGAQTILLTSASALRREVATRMEPIPRPPPLLFFPWIIPVAAPPQAWTMTSLILVISSRPSPLSFVPTTLRPLLNPINFTPALKTYCYCS